MFLEVSFNPQSTRVLPLLMLCLPAGIINTAASSPWAAWRLSCSPSNTHIQNTLIHPRIKEDFQQQVEAWDLNKKVTMSQS